MTQAAVTCGGGGHLVQVISHGKAGNARVQSGEHGEEGGAMFLNRYHSWYKTDNFDETRSLLKDLRWA